MNARADFDHDMEGPPPRFDLETLSGDLRDAMLSRIRQMKTTWPLCTEAEQSDIANGIDMAARNFVREGVRALLGFDIPKVVVKFEEMKIVGGKGIVGKVSCANIAENRDALGENVGDHVLVMMVDSANFMNERNSPDITPDQAALPLDVAADEAEAAGFDEPEAELSVPLEEAAPGAPAELPSLDAVIRLVVAEQTCSAAFLQERFNVVPAAASVIVKALRDAGIIGAFDTEDGAYVVLCATLAQAAEKLGREIEPGAE